MNNNRIALVTGASRGIGFAIAKLLALNGFVVIGTATSKCGVDIINNSLEYNIIGKILDLSSYDSINNFLSTVFSEFSNIHVLVNNAGITNDSLFIRMSDTLWQSVINVNLTSIFYITKAVLKRMIINKFGRIINIGSVISSIGNIGQVNYATTKSGIIGFSKSLAKEVARYNITVNVISPGFIITDMTKKLSDKQRNNILSKIPLNRFGTPEDIAHVVLFLSSSNSSYITGETINVNGGMYMI
ncbi:MAG: 3-oxoacyl-[acyl-carrier-protein] reductase [Candidatus Lightella neohaematopini]|nr:3-oxoacyl-[acyl-carrier-protein] reductase [Candidatus Lightella neohaematopini]MCV2528698.1 3-oxoacyl-[acyl-carrier-protein] reductase [Candidatus Lightella neohaematopini]